MDEWGHKRHYSTHDDVGSEPRPISQGNIKLHGYFGFSHKEPWLHNDKKVREKVELCDFKMMHFEGGNLIFLCIYINYDKSTLCSLFENFR
jgi:hypothetical protein